MVETVVTVSTAPFGSVVVVVVVVVVVDIVPKGAPRTLDSALTVRASARCMQPQGAEAGGGRVRTSLNHLPT